MNKTFNLLFFVKKSKIKANGTAPIYLRITIDGIPKEISSKRNIIPQKWDSKLQKVTGSSEEVWDSKLQKVTGSSEEVKAINNYLKTLEHEVFDAHHQMMKDKTATTSGTLKSKLVGTEQRPKMLVPIFQDHNNKVETLVGNEYAPGTLERYKTSLKHTIEFLKWKYAVSDIEIKNIDHCFITEYEFYLRSVR